MVPTPSSPGPRECGRCGAARDGGRYCEACGNPDDDDPAVRPPPGWTAQVRSDRRRFTASGAGEEGVEFPGDYARTVVLTASSIRIGRRSRREPGLPEIDLTGPPTDPGISRRHARLLWHDRGWTLLDLGSTNGTFLNDSPTPIPPHRSVLLAHGDLIGVGLWTCLRISATG